MRVRRSATFDAFHFTGENGEAFEAWMHGHGNRIIQRNVDGSYVIVDHERLTARIEAGDAVIQDPNTDEPFRVGAESFTRNYVVVTESCTCPYRFGTPMENAVLGHSDICAIKKDSRGT